jgi:hypothetical protein
MVQLMNAHGGLFDSLMDADLSHFLKALRVQEQEQWDSRMFPQMSG